jgi:hypothetical protein
VKRSRAQCRPASIQQGSQTGARGIILKLEKIAQTFSALNTAQSRLKSAYNSDTSQVQSLRKTLLIFAKI